MIRYISTFLVACAVVLSGCNSVGSPPAAQNTPQTAASTGPFNATDVMFLQMMVPHHAQGIEIVRLAKSRPVRNEVKLLAAAIESTQANEAETMAGWLAAWGRPASAAPDEHAAHGGMPGTSAAEIAALVKAGDADFERKFLNMLIAHQDDAIQMARLEKSGGADKLAKELADRIDKSRSAQIQQMKGFLG